MNFATAVFLTGTLAKAIPLASRSPRHTGKQALYFQDNNPDGAAIISLGIDPRTGMLSNPIRTLTGGLGLFAIKNGTAPTTDTTFSQDIVFASDTDIFTANTGSATVSHLVITPSEPQHLAVKGEPGHVEGGFPNAVAYSPRHKLVCAVTTGACASVTCFDLRNGGGLVRRGNPIPLPQIQQTTPPHGPDGTASDIVFNPSETALFVTIKSNSTMAPGFIYALPVRGGGPVGGSAAVVSRPPELNHDFSLTFLSGSRAVISDTTFGAAILRIAPDLIVTTEVKTVIPGHKATCWTLYAPEYDAIYVMDGANPNVTVLDAATGAIRYQLDGPADGLGAFDAARAVGGRYLYVLLGKAGIAVWDLEGSKGSAGKKPTLVQSLDLTSLGSRQGWQGLVAYPN